MTDQAEYRPWYVDYWTRQPMLAYMMVMLHGDIASDQCHWPEVDLAHIWVAYYEMYG